MYKVMKKLSILAIAVFCSGTALSAPADFNADDAFNEANSLYRHNQYPEALAQYQKIEENGFENGNLYYNMGNCYFKEGKYGRAILNYERAKLFIPGDSDLRSNEEYAFTLLGLGPQTTQGNPFSRIVDRIFAGIGINLLTLWLSLLYILTIGLFILRLFTGARFKFFRSTLLALAVIFAITAFGLYRKIEFLNQAAVVVSKDTEAKFEPLEGATTYFTLSEGSKVLVLEHSGNWYKIKRPDNKVGWVDKPGLEMIF
jgi:tetratricopeptide (TPR) repeat protein